MFDLKKTLVDGRDLIVAKNRKQKQNFSSLNRLFFIFTSFKTFFFQINSVGNRNLPKLIGEYI